MSHIGWSGWLPDERSLFETTLFPVSDGKNSRIFNDLIGYVPVMFVTENKDLSHRNTVHFVLKHNQSLSI